MRIIIDKEYTMNFQESLQWRYATKIMTDQVVSEDKIERIIEAISLSPTSSGLQPFEVLIIKNQELKERIRKISWNQSVVTDCSHLLVFAAWDTYTPERINRMFDLTIEVRGKKSESLEKYREMLLATYPQQDAATNFHHASKQAYIAFANAMTAAAFDEVDTTPLEGFDPAELDIILGLREKGLGSCLMLAVGYRDGEKDKLNGLPKVRKPLDELVTVID